MCYDLSTSSENEICQGLPHRSDNFQRDAIFLAVVVQSPS